MDASEFRRHGHSLVEWIADYLEHSDRYPVLPRVAPGDVTKALPSAAPEQPESFDAVWADVERVLVPALTHWNHPGFFGYFAISSSPPAVLAEFLAAALNQQAMLWRTSPASTELEGVSLGWLRQLLGLPDAFDGVIYDTASISTVHALAAAREAAVQGVRQAGLAGRPAVGPVRVYCSDQAHSSVDKAVVLLGLGQDALCRLPCDDAFRLSTPALRHAIASDRAAGVRPMAVVATLGTTSTTSVDPVADIADVCETERLWLHVDAAYAGVAAMLPHVRPSFSGWERADSIVVNPHKWLFVPFDLSAFFTRRMDVLRQAFSLVPEYLRTPEDAAGARNLMDTGVQLGRRFRSLKLWMMMRTYGAEGLRHRLAAHMALAQRFAGWVDDSERFERLAPTPFSVVCFRARPPGVPTEALDDFNQRLVDSVNAQGDVFVSHTKLRGVFTIRLAIGHLRTTETHVARAWELLNRRSDALAADFAR